MNFNEWALIKELANENENENENVRFYNKTNLYQTYTSTVPQTILSKI